MGFLAKTEPISNLLKSLFEAIFPKDTSSESVSSQMQYHPFEDLDKILKESGFTFPTEETTEIPVHPEEGNGSTKNMNIEPVEHTSQDVFKVTSIDVIKNLDLFKQFIHDCDDMSQAGFDVNEVVEKLDAIRYLLLSYDALS